MTYDAIVVGAGHNGLVAAFYLARAGLKVLVLEAQAQVGGCCVTEELIPGYRFSTCANVLWALRPKVVRDMKLTERGLTVDTRQFLKLLPDGRYQYLPRVNSVKLEDTGALAREVAKFSVADAAAMPAWQEFLNRLVRILGPWLMEKPPRLHEIYARCTDPADRAALDAVLTNSIATLADRYFESDLMRDVGVAADIGDIHAQGTGLLYALTLAMGSYSETGEPVLNGYVRGGMGRITELMREAVVELGVTVRTGAPVAKIEIENGRVQGVELVSGEKLSSARVVSNVDPKRTFLGLIAPGVLPEKFLGRIRALQTHGAAGLKIHCALSEMLDYRLADANLSAAQLREATFQIGTDRAYREAAWAAAARGELPTDPIIAAFLPSVYDPTLAPAGCYTWSGYITWAPVHPRRGTWSQLKAEMAENIFRVMDRYTTNFRRALVDYVLLTPEDLDQRQLITDGNIHHLDAIPSQLLWQRPLEELAQYRGPAAGLYLCGSGSHPWGEVSGAPGHNAAQAILADRI